MAASLVRPEPQDDLPPPHDSAQSAAESEGKSSPEIECPPSEVLQSRAERARGKWEPPTVAELQVALPQYEVLNLLGRGGMGAVYKGRQTNLDRLVAIKILPPNLGDDGQDYAERFKNEARAMARLTHPGIVAVHDFGQTADGLLYFVMECVEGTDVGQMVAQQGRLPDAHALAITAHVCDALQYAHDHGIIHRDIKPSNIMVGCDGAVKVADFGLAKSTREGETAITHSSMAMGTLHYMAPEALTLGTEVDHRADVYAVGVMLYQMLTGKLPQGLFEMPSARVPDLDPRYDGIVAKALREDRNVRYQSAKELRRDLDAILTTPVVKEAPAEKQAPPRKRPQPSRREAAPPPRQQVIVRTEEKSSPLLWAALLVIGAIAAWLIWERGRAGPNGAGTAGSTTPPKASLGNNNTLTTKAESAKSPLLNAQWVDALPGILADSSGSHLVREPDGKSARSTLSGRLLAPVGLTMPLTDQATRATVRGEAWGLDIRHELDEAGAPARCYGLSAHRRYPGLRFGLAVAGKSFSVMKTYPWPAGFDWSAPHTVEIHAIGSVLSLFLDGQKLDEVNDTRIARGIPKLYADAGGVIERFEFADLSVTPPMPESKWIDAMPGIWADSARSKDLEREPDGKAARIAANGGWTNPLFPADLDACLADQAVRATVRGEKWGIDIRHERSVPGADVRSYGVQMVRTNPGLRIGFAIRGKAYSPIQVFPWPAGFDWNAAHTVEMRAVGSALSVSLDGKKLGDITDDRVAKGYPQIFAETGSVIEGFEYADLGPASPPKAVIAVSAPSVSEKPVAVKPGEWIDALALVDPARDTLRPEMNTWTRIADGFKSARVDQQSRTYAGTLQLPVAIPSSYLIEAEFTPTRQDCNVGIKIPASGSGTTCWIASNGYAGIAKIDGKDPHEHSSASGWSSPFKLVPGNRHKMCIQVRRVPDGVDIQFLVDGDWVGNYRGPSSRLTISSSWPKHGDPARAEIGTNDLITVHSARIRSLSDVDPASPPQTDARLAKLEADFKERLETEALKPYRDAVGTLKNSYIVNGLARARAEAARKRRLDDVPVLDAEQKRLTSGGDVPAVDAPGTLASLAALQKTYRDTVAKYAADRDQKSAPIYEAHLKALDEYAVELIKAGSLDAARQAKAARKLVSVRQTLPPDGFTNSLGMKFVPVPGTQILMCIHETRKGDYAKYAAANPGVNSKWMTPMADGVSVSERDDHPVVMVDWEESRAFCSWLSQKEGQAYRLPTDREWSIAAGIGDLEIVDSTPKFLDGKVLNRYPWGTTWPPPPHAGNYADVTLRKTITSRDIIEGYNDGYVTTAPVMSFMPNQLGIHDLGGNVSEWCEDWVDESHTERVLRGNCWDASRERHLLSSFRQKFIPTGSQYPAHRGFRCVIEVASLSPQPLASTHSAAQAPRAIATAPTQSAPASNPVPKGPATLTGRVMDEDGRPVSGCSVKPYGGYSDPSTATTTDAQGRYTITIANPGSVRGISAYPASSSSMNGDSKSVALKPGDQAQINFALIHDREVKFDYVYQPDDSRDFLPGSPVSGTIVMSLDFRQSDIVFQEGKAGNFSPHDLNFDVSEGRLNFDCNYGSGKGNGFVDLGPVVFGSVKQAPESGYNLTAKACVVGHVYVVRTYDGHYAKLVVKEITKAPSSAQGGGSSKRTQKKSP